MLLVLWLRAADHLQLQSDGLDGMVAGEEFLVPYHLSEDAADGPGVDGLAMLSRCQQHFRRTIHLHYTVVCVEIISIREPRTPNLRDAQLPASTDPQNTGLQIAVYNICRVQVLESAEGLVSEGTDTCLRELLIS